MRLNASGNLSVNNTVNLYRCHIRGLSTDTIDNLRIDNSRSDNQCFVSLVNNAGHSLYCGLDGTNSALIATDSTTTTFKVKCGTNTGFFIDSSNNVFLYGIVYAQNDMNIAGDCYIHGAGYVNNGVNIVSDRQFKTNIIPVSYGTTGNIFDNLQLYQYDLSVSGVSTKNEIGVISQEMPEEFSTENNGIMYMNYNRLYNCNLIETIALRKRVKTLEDTVELLLQKFKNLDKK